MRIVMPNDSRGMLDVDLLKKHGGNIEKVKT